MRNMHTRTATTALLLTLGGAGMLTGCGGDGRAEPAPTSSTPTSSTPTYDDAYAYKEGEKAIRARTSSFDPLKQTPKAPWITESYRAQVNRTAQKWATEGYTTKGSQTLLSITPKASTKTGPTGWNIVMTACFHDKGRLINPQGEDVTGDSKGNRVPPEGRKVPFDFELVTPDKGKTWAINGVEQNYDEAVAKRCAATS